MSKLPGAQAWLDLTVDDADSLRDFYAELLGWTPHPVAMSDDDGDYADYAMIVGEGPVGGVCHRRGTNAALPPMWLPYFLVEDLAATLAAAVEKGAEVLDARDKMAVLRDPAGACFAVYLEEADAS